MRKAILAAISIAALAAAGPAFAQSSGTVTGGGGIGLGLGGFTNGSVNTGNVNGTNDSSYSGTISNSLSGSSGSGFGGTMNISSLPGGSSYAVVGGAGEAGTSISTSVDPTAVGTIESTSYNAGIYGGATGGNASLDIQVMNFGQSAASYKYDLSFSDNSTLNFNENFADWNAAGAVGIVGFGFGSFGWSGDPPAIPTE